MITENNTLNQFVGRARQVWVWWTGELVSIYDSLFLLNQKQPVKISVDTNDKINLVTELDTKKLNKKKINIFVPVRHVMYKTVRLPLNARNNIKQVIEYEFDKYFPLNVNDAYFGCKIFKPVEVNCLNVGIWAIRKSYLSKLIHKIQLRYSLEIKEAVVVNSAWQALITTSVLRNNNQTDSTGKKQYFPYYRYIAVLLVILILVTPLIKMQHLNENLLQQIRQLEEQAKDTIFLKNNINIIETGLNELVKSKKSTPSITEIWSELTNIISGNGYVNNVRFYEGKIKLDGKANSVEKIVKLLEQNKNFTEISIDAPVRRLEQGRFESMSISFKVSNDI